MKYLINCFWLLIPLFVWNIVFISRLPCSYAPATFWKDIPPLIGTTENIARMLVFTLPVLMQFSLKTPVQKAGLSIYLLGLVLYFASWLLQIYFLQSDWSRSLWGYTAPAYTTIIFFVGISLIGQTSWVKLPGISVIYLVVSIIFVVVHTAHSYLVFQRLNE
ncbi:MAG: hypothetical protein ACFB15_22550 [Cyclobacteriaceae bacterium]